MSPRKRERTINYSVYFLGPLGSFSNVAARRALHILIPLLTEEVSYALQDSNFDLQPCSNQEQIAAGLISDHNAFAVVPISNNRRGDVYDYMPFCRYETVALLDVPVSFCLCSKSSITDIKGLITKTIAYSQIRDDLQRHLPRALDLSRINEDTSTSKAAEIAAREPTLAAICSRETALEYGLNILVDKIESTPIQTTFGVFRNAEVSFTPPESVASQYNWLMRGAHVYSGRHTQAGLKAFAGLLSNGKPLTIKWGVDPIYESLHLGHLSNLLKLRDFMQLGHNVVIVIGTFTGTVGDPSGNLTRRALIDAPSLRRNGERILEQINRILGPSQFQVIWNDTLFEAFDLQKFVKWMYDTEVKQIQDRPDFQSRVSGRFGLSVAEFVYPLFQAFDTAHVEPDIELGGIDQLWNCILCKDILKREGLKVPLVLLVDTVKGTNGAAKMSAFEGNAISLDESDIKITRKIMQLPNDLLPGYFTALTRIPDSEIREMTSALSMPQVAKPWKTRLATQILDAIRGRGAGSPTRD